LIAKGICYWIIS